MILVAGGAGLVGSNLLLALRKIGAEVRATYHLNKPQIRDSSVEYLKCDLTKKEDCERVTKGVDIVFMCAAVTSGAAVIAGNPLVHVTSNIVMNSQMLQASYDSGVEKFVWMSSNIVYPPTGSRPAKEEEMLRGNPYEAYFAAGWMKRYTEILCQIYSEKLSKAMSTVVVRPTNLYGPYDKFDFATSHVTAALIRRVVEQQDPISVWGDGKDVRDTLYIDDFIDALLKATERVKTYDPINIGFGKGYSVMEILRNIMDVAGYRAKIEFDRSKPSMIPVRLVDISKARRLLDFSPRVTLKEGLRRTVAWYRKNSKPVIGRSQV
jgi:GDP-L-fucose synthase